ncbi:uncharacterized protein LOC131891917 [Tigriopus californicus]|uniref:uncharacterized protein LOC131891917 n=1 Tax=Tigriopus californicus TaxID=6832 RepID=UPI0027DA988F|nr:uncharacterized protein LOC131891917 [Tigriopus californicus]
MAQEKCSRSFIYKVKDLVEAGDSLGRKTGSGGSNKKRTGTKLAEIKAKIEKKPDISLADLGKVANVSKTTASAAVKDLGLKSYVRRHRQLITTASKATRVIKGKKLLAWMKKNPRVVRVFSDEKFWTVDQARNAQNDRWLATTPGEVPHINRTKHPAGAMMLGVVASDGKAMPPYWFPKGLKINTEEYLKVMRKVVKPWLDATYPLGNYVWQQDSAPAHKAKKTQKWCQDNLAASWPWAMWPPSSPDCSPLDYGI